MTDHLGATSRYHGVGGAWADLRMACGAALRSYLDDQPHENLGIKLLPNNGHLARLHIEASLMMGDGLQ